MKCDEYEPVEIVSGLQQVGDAQQIALNRNGWADYLWQDCFGKWEQVERKQVPELLSSMDHVEEQLRRHLQNKPEAKLTLLIEGIAEPDANGIKTFVLSKDGRYFRSARFFKTRYDRYEGFCVSLERAGVNIWRTSSWVSTIQALARMEAQAQRPDTSVMNRYVKIPSFHPNPQVETLMGIKGANIGPKTAESLIEVFGDVWTVLRQDAETIAKWTPGVGKVGAEKLLKAIGKL